MITKWIRHTRKIAVTTVTFQLFGGPCDAWLPNWMKWYSNWNLCDLCSESSRHICDIVTATSATSAILVPHPPPPVCRVVEPLVNGAKLGLDNCTTTSILTDSHHHRPEILACSCHLASPLQRGMWAPFSCFWVFGLGGVRGDMQNSKGRPVVWETQPGARVSQSFHHHQLTNVLC